MRAGSTVHPDQRLRFLLPAADTSPAEARRRTRGQLMAWAATQETCENAALVISELVTNALRHTESATIGCELRAGGPLLRVAVAGAGQGPERRVRQADRDDEGGRGLLLVCALARMWGVRRGLAGEGHVVWADLPLGRAGR
ncbi:ATP-binding protein [Streptomyces marincola]|uniref:ATP-binding protein n=1 Tax=Streptomyces marincola TaxID=2878388 RepID=UPI001CF39926|nr:ATP-binding protein [Streptomyces marincola]UCM91569.1 ATP-binding protein [Streptomyces marincola]